MSRGRQNLVRQIVDTVPKNRWMTNHEILWHLNQRYTKYSPSSRELSAVLHRMHETETRRIGLNGATQFRIK
jgi:hypothetical protein